MQSAWLLPFGVMSLSCATLAGLSDVPNAVDGGPDASRADGAIHEPDTGTKPGSGTGAGEGRESGPETGGVTGVESGADGENGTGSGTGHVPPPPAEAGAGDAESDATYDAATVWVVTTGADASMIDKCQSSCGNPTPGGGNPFLDVLSGCICVAGGACRATCSNTLCSDVEPFSDDSCSKCIAQMDESCATMASGDCRNDAMCGSWLDCVTECEEGD